MGILTTVCAILAILGLIVCLLAILPPTAGRFPGGLSAGLTMVVVGVVLYVVLALILGGGIPITMNR